MSKNLKIAHDLGGKWRSDDVVIQDEASFSGFLLSSEVNEGLKKAGYQVPSPIQIEALPIGLFGRDMIVQAKSGTGKTLVFTIIGLEIIKPNIKHPQVLVTTPTREIAIQIRDVFRAVGSGFKDLSCHSFIGGIKIETDADLIPGCEIVVGTPGRLRHLISLGILPTNYIRLFVIDEADVMMESHFKNDIDFIFMSLPKMKQVIATSATYPEELSSFDTLFKKPFLARLNYDELSLRGMDHFLQQLEYPKVLPLIEYRAKLKALENLLCSVDFTQCLVFCNSKHKVANICMEIRKWGFSTSYISSDRDQTDRIKAITSLKRFKCKVLVTSDLSARGIDSEKVDMIVHYDKALSSEIYFHRCGRAGRYGTRGIAVTLMSTNDDFFYKNEEHKNFVVYYLPDPIPEDLINIKPEECSPIRKYIPVSTESKKEIEEKSHENEEKSHVAVEENIASTSDNLILTPHDKMSECKILPPENMVNNNDEVNETEVTLLTEKAMIECFENEKVDQEISLSVKPKIMSVEINGSPITSPECSEISQSEIAKGLIEKSLHNIEDSYEKEGIGCVEDVSGVKNSKASKTESSTSSCSSESLSKNKHMLSLSSCKQISTSKNKGFEEMPKTKLSKSNYYGGTEGDNKNKVNVLSPEKLHGTKKKMYGSSVRSKARESFSHQIDSDTKSSKIKYTCQPEGLFSNEFYVNQNPSDFESSSRYTRKGRKENSSKASKASSEHQFHKTNSILLSNTRGRKTKSKYHTSAANMISEEQHYPTAYVSHNQPNSSAYVSCIPQNIPAYGASNLRNNSACTANCEKNPAYAAYGGESDRSHAFYRRQNNPADHQNKETISSRDFQRHLNPLYSSQFNADCCQCRYENGWRDATADWYPSYSSQLNPDCCICRYENDYYNMFYKQWQCIQYYAYSGHQ